MRRYFLAGLLFWLPIWATYVVIRFLFELLDGSLALLPHKYQPEQLIGHHIPGLGIVFAVVIVFITGLLVTNFIGHRLVSSWERLLSRIPLIRSIHTAVKQVVHAFIKPKGDSFRKVLLVEYPRKGVWSIAFQTANQFTAQANHLDRVVAFVPTTPNPTSGFLIVVPREDSVELDISVEEAFKMIISLGVVMPNHKVTSHSNEPSTDPQPPPTK